VEVGRLEKTMKALCHDGQRTHLTMKFEEFNFISDEAGRAFLGVGSPSKVRLSDTTPLALLGNLQGLQQFSISFSNCNHVSDLSSLSSLGQ